MGRKTLFHSELVNLCEGGTTPTTITIKEGPCKSKWDDNPAYFKVELNGESRYLNPETPQISADLGAHVGRMIVATFSGDREQGLMVIQGQQGAAQPPAQPPQYQQAPAVQPQPPPSGNYHPPPNDPHFAPPPPPPQQAPRNVAQAHATPDRSSDPQMAGQILQQGMNLYWKIWGRVHQDAAKMLQQGYPMTSEDKRCAVSTMFIFATRHEREGLPYSHSVVEAMPRQPVWPEPIVQ